MPQLFFYHFVSQYRITKRGVIAIVPTCLPSVLQRPNTICSVSLWGAVTEYLRCTEKIQSDANIQKQWNWGWMERTLWRPSWAQPGRLSCWLRQLGMVIRPQYNTERRLVQLPDTWLELVSVIVRCELGCYAIHSYHADAGDRRRSRW